ncbi:MAG: hypothetical protein IT580_09555 [Verrucomicrobiales bacterium]|nr:hypothetical protein [Verrucomicrobiales bacterium]
MAAEPLHPAEVRLRAMARTRQLAAGALPPLSDLSRRRLRDEVDRIQAGGHVIQDAVTRPRDAGRFWRVVLAWGGVGAACLALVWVVLFSNRPARPSVTLAKSDTAELDAVLPPPPPAAAAERSVSSAAAPVDSSADASGVAATPTIVRSAAVAEAPAVASSAREGRFDFASAQRVRHPYRLATGATPPPILGTFDMIQTGGGIEIIDADGSTYSGRHPRRAPSEERSPAWTFEARGFSRTLGKSVQITGNFGTTLSAAERADRTREGSRDEAGEAADAATFFRQRVSATVLVDGSSVFEVLADPAPAP